MLEKLDCQLSNEELVKKIQDNNDSSAVDELMVRNVDLCYSLIHKYTSHYNENNLYELLEQVHLIFNQAIKTYKTGKGCKFLSWLGIQTRFWCLNSQKRNKIKTTSFENSDIDLINNLNNNHFSNSNDIKDKSDYALNILKNLKDPRIYDIFKQRYIEGGKGNKTKPWQEISKKMKLSITMCINLENTGLKILKEKLKDSNLNDKT